MEGVSKDFVSIDMHHDMKQGTLELTQADYWDKAVERFKDFLAPSDPKRRAVPMSVSDMAYMVEATEDAIEGGKHLPFPQILGVIQYPSAFTK